MWWLKIVYSFEIWELYWNPLLWIAAGKEKQGFLSDSVVYQSNWMRKKKGQKRWKIRLVKISKDKIRKGEL